MRKTFLLAGLCALLTPGFIRGQMRSVAMTVDDLPIPAAVTLPLNLTDVRRATEVNERILRDLSRNNIPAIGFVNEQRAEQLGMTISRKILKQWVRPNFDLGNHLYSHADVNSLSVEQVEHEITHGEKTIAPLLASVSRKPEFFRFPYNHTGDTKEKHDAIAAFLLNRGYRLAPCTIDNSDFEFNKAYVLALAHHDKEAAGKLRADYVAYTGQEIDWYTALNKQVFGYEPPHIMLLHDNSLNADTIVDVLLLFKQRRYTFVRLAEALKDPAYSVPETYVTKYGPMWGYRWAEELHVRVNGRGEPQVPRWIEKYANDNVVGQ